MGYEYILRGIVQYQRKNSKAHEKEKVTICMPEIINKKSQKVSVNKYKSKIDQSASRKKDQESKEIGKSPTQKKHLSLTPVETQKYCSPS